MFFVEHALKRMERINMTTNELKDYLHNVYLLEKQKYAIECSYTSLQNQIKQCQDIIERQKNVKLSDDAVKVSIGEHLGNYIRYFFVGGYFIGGFGYLIDAFSLKWGGLGELIDKILTIVFVVIWPIGQMLIHPAFSEWINSWNARLLIIFFIILTIGTIGSYFFDKKSVKQSNRDNAKSNEAIIFNSKQTIKEKENYIEMSLVPECSYLRNIYEETTSLLHNLYSLGIIGEKYQNLIAISSFHEYFEYGRCDSLSGPYGAYNKYEDELYKKIIIGRLEDIILKLDDIRNNQIMIYHAIEDSKNQTTKLLSDLKSQNDNNHQDAISAIDNIEYNTRCIQTNQEIEFYWNTINQKNY